MKEKSPKIVFVGPFNWHSVDQDDIKDGLRPSDRLIIKYIRQATGNRIYFGLG